jgi:hypothetical protein
MNECMYVINNQNKQKEWHPATKPLFFTLGGAGKALLPRLI